MIHTELHKKPAVLERVKHRRLALRTDLPTVAAAAGLNSFFITAAEFAEAAREYPILFLRAGADEEGREQIAPMVALGLAQGENLYLGDGRWHARYVPALLRSYPFTIGRVGPQQHALCIDESWAGWGTTATPLARALFDDQGEPTAFLKEVNEFAERIEVEVERTRRLGLRLLEMKLLREKRFDATLSNGRKVHVDGFMAVDEERMAALTDAEIVDLHRSGLLPLLNIHQVSLGHLGALVERRSANDAPG
jgi:hypothetical protein